MRLMVRSVSETVSVSMLSSELFIALSRASGPPGDVIIGGYLYREGTAIPIPFETVDIWINGSYVGSATTNASGLYGFTQDFPEGSFDIYTSWDGNDTYGGDVSPLIKGVYAKIQAAISMTRAPSSGAPPLAVTVSGYLSRADSGLGLGDRRARLFRDGVEIDSMLTKDYAPGLGYYEFHDVIDVTSSYYVEFRGDDMFEGCSEDEVGLPCTECGSPIPVTVVGAEVECLDCHAIFETVIV